MSEAKAQSKTPVLCVTTGQEFVSIKDAAKCLNLHPGNVSAVCRGRCKQTGGYSFKYLDKSHPKE